MTIEIGGAQVLGLLLALLTTFASIWMRRLHADLAMAHKAQAEMQAALAGLRETMAREASTYASRDELMVLIQRIEAKLDRLAEKLHTKQDRS